MRKNKKIMVGLIAGVLMIGGIGGTAYAWFVNRATTSFKMNKSVTHGLAIEGNVEGGYDENIMPGDVYPISLYVTNTASYDQEVRLEVEVYGLPCKAYVQVDTGYQTIKSGDTALYNGFIEVDEDATIEDINGNYEIQIVGNAFGYQIKK